MEEDDTIAVALRIKQFIDSLGITITQFADNTGIQRSSMSQILSGRNQKISILTIGKIHKAYPNLSIYWLLYGNGPMLTGSSSETPIESDTNEESRLPATDNIPSLFDEENRINAPTNTGERQYVKENEPNRLFKQPEDIGNEHERNQNNSKLDPRTLDEKNRRVTKIMIFYSDNTFESFSPDSMR